MNTNNWLAPESSTSRPHAWVSVRDDERVAKTLATGSVELPHDDGFVRRQNGSEEPDALRCSGSSDQLKAAERRRRILGCVDDDFSVRRVRREGDGLRANQRNCNRRRRRVSAILHGEGSDAARGSRTEHLTGTKLIPCLQRTMGRADPDAARIHGAGIRPGLRAPIPNVLKIDQRTMFDVLNQQACRAGENRVRYQSRNRQGGREGSHEDRVAEWTVLVHPRPCRFAGTIAGEERFPRSEWAQAPSRGVVERPKRSWNCKASRRTGEQLDFITSLMASDARSKAARPDGGWRDLWLRQGGRRSKGVDFRWFAERNETLVETGGDGRETTWPWVCDFNLGDPTQIRIHWTSSEKAKEQRVSAREGLIDFICVAEQSPCDRYEHCPVSAIACANDDWRGEGCGGFCPREVDGLLGGGASSHHQSNEQRATSMCPPRVEQRRETRFERANQSRPLRDVHVILSPLQFYTSAPLVPSPDKHRCTPGPPEHSWVSGAFPARLPVCAHRPSEFVWAELRWRRPSGLVLAQMKL
jgi:hypothetical protein